MVYGHFSKITPAQVPKFQTKNRYYFLKIKISISCPVTLFQTNNRYRFPLGKKHFFYSLILLEMMFKTDVYTWVLPRLVECKGGRALERFYVTHRKLGFGLHQCRICF